MKRYEADIMKDTDAKTTKEAFAPIPNRALSTNTEKMGRTLSLTSKRMFKWYEADILKYTKDAKDAKTINSSWTTEKLEKEGYSYVCENDKCIPKQKKL